MKCCSYCHRTFLKTEHLLRHERSHTGEKPFKCHTCNRRYSRSDVLIRHAKFFHSQDQPKPSQPRDGVTDETPHSPWQHSTGRDLGRGSNGSSRIDTDRDDRDDNGPIHPGPQTRDRTMSTHSTSRDGFLPVADGLMASSLGTLAEASMLQSQSEAVENNSAAGSSSIRQGSTGSLSQTRTDNVLPSLAAGGMTQSLGDMGLGNPSDLIRATDNVSPYGSQSFQDLIDIDPNLGASLGGHGMGNAAGDGDAGYLQNLDYFNLMEVCGDINMNEASPTPDPAGSIPVERFDKVARLWPNPGGKCMADDEATRLWTDVVAHKGDNILADTSVAGASPVPSVGRESGFSWGLDDDGRLDMIRELRQSLPGFDTIADRFPPTRLLNVSLDAVFRQSSSLLQCIHRPTFSAKTAPPLVTLSACLLGLVILDHADIRPLALLYLPAATQRCCHRLASLNIGPDRTAKVVANLTSALLLTQAWTFCPPRCLQFETATRLLISQAITVSQVSGLFAVRQSSPRIDDIMQQYKAKHTLHGQPPEDDVLWKAWARTESVKRLVSSLIVMDAWVANRLDDTPFLRTRSIRFEYPCSPELFKCPSSATWRRLVNGEAYPSSESILVHMNVPVIRLPAASCDMAKEGIFSVLSIIWIRMQQISPEALATTQLEDPNAITDVCPTILASCQGGRALSHALSTMYTSNTHLLGSKNPNSIAFWNLLNLRLFARVDVLELAAGRQGADRAHMALKQTAAWCQTRYARRACLHAGEIFASMSRCRLKDGTMVHSEAAMFSAALVLGLYVFMMGPDGHGSEGGHTGTPAEEPYEFLDPVDWSKIDDVAVGDDSFEVSGVVTNSSESAAARFVRHGGAVSFSGVVCESGYNASKMILLEFASLLEEVGKWKSKGSVHILRIMSDSLLDVDFANP